MGIESQLYASSKLKGDVDMYIDPASGGMLIQIIVAIIAAGGALVFGLRKKIKALFSKNKDENNSAGTEGIPHQARNDADPADVIDMLEDK